VRQADVVGVHPGDHVVATGGEPALERLSKADVVREAKPPHRHRRSGLEALERRGQLGFDVAVLNHHDLVGATQLVVN